MIAEEAQFGKAVRLLRIAQPALSRQGRLLEDELGLALFEGLPRGIRLTAAGRVFAAKVSAALARLGVAVARVRAAAAGQAGVLRVGFIEVAAWDGLVPQPIARFRAGFSEVGLVLSARPSANQIAAMRARWLDAGIVQNPPRSGP